MNYRHAYHAGNFADVVKHAVLALVIERLKQKDAAFRVIDTHAGIGSYELTSEAARKTREWESGIGRLLGPAAGPLPPAVEPLLRPYLNVVRALNEPGKLECYPGSPRVARALIRPQDTLVVNELHPEDVASLRTEFNRDRQTKVMHLDGWIALKSLLPPKERRGVVLIDPPFEAPGELDRIVEGLIEARKRFANGIYVVWYPIKAQKSLRDFYRRLPECGFEKLLKADFFILPPDDPEQLNGCGLLIANPPYRLDEDLEIMLSFLADRLAAHIPPKSAGRAELAWLAQPRNATVSLRSNGNTPGRSD